MVHGWGYGRDGIHRGRKQHEWLGVRISTIPGKICTKTESKPLDYNTKTNDLQEATADDEVEFDEEQEQEQEMENHH